MRAPILSLLTLMLAGCTATAQRPTDARTLTLTGNTLPAISHVNDMKIAGDTLWLVYETADGYGQRFIRRAIIDTDNLTLDFGAEMGRKADGYYVSYMPYPVNGCDGPLLVASQDDGEIYRAEDDGALSRTQKAIFSDECTLPFPLSQYVQDVSMVGGDEFVFIGRRPNGGPQYALKANIAAARIDTIRCIRISSDLAPWMPNAGELAYSKPHDRLAFAYRLHPVIAIFAIDGKPFKQVRVGPDTFSPATLAQADFEDLNPLHFVDISATPRCIYALHWGFKASESAKSSPTIFKIAWDGQILSTIRPLPARLSKIAASDSIIIGWRPDAFCLIRP